MPLPLGLCLWHLLLLAPLSLVTKCRSLSFPVTKPLCFLESSLWPFYLDPCMCCFHLSPETWAHIYKVSAALGHLKVLPACPRTDSSPVQQLLWSFIFPQEGWQYFDGQVQKTGILLDSSFSAAFPLVLWAKACCLSFHNASSACRPSNLASHCLSSGLSQRAWISSCFIFHSPFTTFGAFSQQHSQIYFPSTGLIASVSCSRGSWTFSYSANYLKTQTTSPTLP